MKPHSEQSVSQSVSYAKTQSVTAKTTYMKSKKTFDGVSFNWSKLETSKQTRRINSKCIDFGNSDNPYVVEIPSHAYWSVMFRGCCSFNPMDQDDKSLIGLRGHLERANAWTHFIPCIFFMLFSFVRPFALGASTVSDHMSNVSIVLTAATFAVSTVYHVYSAVPSAAPATRTLDHASIAISLCGATIADLSMTTKDFQNVSFQAWLDPMVGALVLIVYFGVRRLFVPENETQQESYTGEGCTLGLYRVFHSDLEHASLRAAGSAALTLNWVLLIPSAFRMLDVDPAVIWVTGASIGTLLLIFGIILDNTGVVDDMLMRNQRIGPCSCNSQALGCVFNTHALWHIIAVAGAVSSIFAREYGIASWK